jgi:hypothetical protein
MSRFGAADLSETFEEILNGCAKTVAGLGGLATLVAVGLLVFTCFRLGGGSVSQSEIADGTRNVEIFQKVLIAGVVGLAIGATFLFWGEELLGAIQLALAAALFFAPLYLPGILGGTPNAATEKALGALQMGGTILGALGLLVLLSDIAVRVNQRVKTGTKADQLKYGKGIKEEGEKKNIILGKCWQLPYCRKFVRERCPIFHAGRTCWKELVGCMCEEQVIRNAMENKPIPKDALLAANFIPQNHRLSVDQKKQRCYSCVIYNEHQRHKYKVGMWVTVPGFFLFYFLAHPLLFNAVYGILLQINKVINHATLGVGGNYKPPDMFVESMLAVIMLIALTYTMKLLEFTIFKVKL